ncbi:hypothetical protein NDU88_004598 [Pleurodeles waltl]|uniref:Uncharacterized protein n=1 Tax=Pleurodeles waltl TaxID=8319 RepID=A0AAV7RKX8_PLEWA|nr:hypothetical protein NDU88_004598 [Pleurodeles waltl]
MILPTKAAGWAPSVQRGHPPLPDVSRGRTARPSLGGAHPPGRGAPPVPQSRRRAGGRPPRDKWAGRSPYLLLAQRARTAAAALGNGGRFVSASPVPL